MPCGEESIRYQNGMFHVKHLYFMLTPTEQIKPIHNDADVSVQIHSDAARGRFSTMPTEKIQSYIRTECFT